MMERRQSQGEEIANSVSHGVGFVAAVASAPILIATTVQTGTSANVIGASVFAATMVLLYCASTLYHAVSQDGVKALLRKLDHGAIFLLIAGTYTPFALVTLRGPWGWTIFAIVWSLAVAGVALKAVFGPRWPILSTAIYIAMGWTVVVAAKPLMALAPPGAIAWLAAGGIAYTGGVAFYAWTRLRYSHAVWHLFVMVGSVCHYIAILRYIALPAA